MSQSPTLRKGKSKCTTLGLIIDFLFDSSNCTVGGQTLTQSDLMLSVRAPDDSPIFGWEWVTGWVTNNCPYLKGTPALPPLDWEKPQHYNWWCDVWRMWFVSNGIIECHIENLQIEIGNRTPNCLRHHVWLDVSTFNKCLFTTNREDSCWSLFVRLHKFLFGEIRLSSFSKRVTSYFSTKPGSIETNPTLVVEVSNVKWISI